MNDLKEGMLRSMSKPANGVKDLGWMNSWKETPPLFIQCEQKDHRRKDMDMSNGRGYEHVITCLEGCNYVARYDSSD